MRKLNDLDKRNLSTGLNAAIWPFLLFGPISFHTGIIASGVCVLAAAGVVIFRDHTRYIGCDWYNRLLLFLPGIAYCGLAIILHAVFGEWTR